MDEKIFGLLRIYKYKVQPTLLQEELSHPSRKSKRLPIGKFPETSDMYNLSLALPIFIVDSLETSPLSPLHYVFLPKKEKRSIGLMNAIMHLGPSRNALLRPPY
jgi:hypothetical protein